MPRSLPLNPRKIFPPPTTTTTCTPRPRTSRICSAMARTACGEMFSPVWPPRASPLSFNSIRLYLGRFASFIASISVDTAIPVATSNTPCPGRQIKVQAIRSTTLVANGHQIQRQHGLARAFKLSCDPNCGRVVTVGAGGGKAQCQFFPLARGDFHFPGEFDAPRVGDNTLGGVEAHGRAQPAAGWLPAEVIEEDWNLRPLADWNLVGGLFRDNRLLWQ